MANPEVHNIALIRYGQPWIIDGKSVFTTIPDTEDAENQVRYAVNYHLQPTSQVREGNDNVIIERTDYFVAAICTTQRKWQG